MLRSTGLVKLIIITSALEKCSTWRASSFYRVAVYTVAFLVFRNCWREKRGKSKLYENWEFCHRFLIKKELKIIKGLPRWLSGKKRKKKNKTKNLPANAGDLGSVPGLERSLGEGNGNPLQDSCLGNPMVRGAWDGAGWGGAGYSPWGCKESDRTGGLTLSLSLYMVGGCKAGEACRQINSILWIEYI